jgi:hypothetical protein
MGWMQPTHFSFPHGLDASSPFLVFPWSGCNQPIFILLFVLLFVAGAKLKLVRKQAACENGKLSMRAEPRPPLHHLRVLARIRKRECAYPYLNFPGENQKLSRVGNPTDS